MPRDPTIAFRVDPATEAAVRQLAEQLGLKPSELLRRFLYLGIAKNNERLAQRGAPSSAQDATAR